jgi:DNA gyrase subunit A
LSSELLADIDKETVDFQPNYDEKELEPSVLPARIPNLLVNGSAGIAVGMATNVPPHNLSEVLGACIALIDDPDLGFEDLMRIVPGPDFPTAGIINGAAGIIDGLQDRSRPHPRARQGQVRNRANGREAIIVTELPYQVNKAR